MGNNTKTSYRLEMRKREDLRPKIGNIQGFRIEKMEIPCPELNKFFHTVVGYEYLWGGRSDWGQDEWYDYVNRDELETWIAYMRGTPAGYFELELQPGGEIQIECIGLLPQFVGKGFGGILLTRALQRSWELTDKSIFLNTCTHDHPHALKNYLARGFRIAESKTSPLNEPIPSFWELVENTR